MYHTYSTLINIYLFAVTSRTVTCEVNSYGIYSYKETCFTGCYWTVTTK